MNGMNTSIKESPESSLTSFHQEQREKVVICEPGSGLSTNTKFASTLMLNFPVSRTVRNKYLYLSCPDYGILL